MTGGSEDCVSVLTCSFDDFLHGKHLATSMSKQNVKNPSQQKNWARSSRQFLQKTNSKFITITPKMGRAPKTPALLFWVLYWCFVRIFWSFWPSFFFGLDFFLAFFSRRLLDEFFVIKNMGRGNKKHGLPCVFFKSSELCRSLRAHCHGISSWGEQ